jgi:glycerate 2-kinase
MRIVVCPDSFKGSMSAVTAASAIAGGLRRGFGSSDVEVIEVPLADGGEGTVEALVRGTGGELHHVRVHDPLMRPIEAQYGILGDGDTAAIEMAAASGLTLIKDKERNPLITSTYGTGELIRAALIQGAKRLVIGIGGSATNDAGAGAMSALGARFLDESGHELPPGGAALSMLASIDMSGFCFPTGDIEVNVACDVTNPLCGPTGASAVFGPQKGATPQMVKTLDAALANFARIVDLSLSRAVDMSSPSVNVSFPRRRESIADMPGAGAAGGLGAGLAAFLNAKLVSGIDLVLDTAGFEDALVGADLVITGEGRIDGQTAHGKTISGVLKRTRGRGVPVIALAGAVCDDLTQLYDLGLTAALSITSGPIPLDEAISRGPELIENLAFALARLLKAAR